MQTDTSHMSVRRLFVMVAAVLLTCAGLVIAGTPAWATAPAPEKKTAKYEVDFMTDMIDHHHMAITMSEMCLDKAVHDELNAMCEDIINAQMAENEQMQG